jgi:uncharacterized LabA/DUF88 family protein
MDRLSVYIDGFNLYFGISDRGWRRYLWLDLVAIARRLAKPDQRLVAVKYFTARVRQDKAKIRRQATYLQALEEIGGITIHYGRYQRRSKECHQCHAAWNEYEEKMSDVKLATELLRDAFKDEFETALIITGDGDLVPPIAAVKEEFPDKKVVIVFPPERDNPRLTEVADESFRLGRGRLAKCQLPYVVTKKNGYKLIKPGEWK